MDNSFGILTKRVCNFYILFYSDAFKVTTRFERTCNASKHTGTDHMTWNWIQIPLKFKIIKNINIEASSWEGSVYDQQVFSL